MISQDLFYAMLACANVLEPELVVLANSAAPQLRRQLEEHPVFANLGRAWQSASAADLHAEL